jgi:hypothetical protein
MSSRVLATVLLSLAAAVAAESPLTIGDVAAGAPGHVRLTNTGGQTVTAWSLAVTTESAQGRKHREVYTADGYLTEVTHGLPNADERLERLMPGESRVVPLDPLPQGAKVEVIATVLDDTTAIGDEAALASIFAHRVQERDAMKAVVAAFNDVLATRHGVDALTALRERLAALMARGDNVPCHAALDAVQTYRQKSDPDDIDRSLRNYGEFVAREYELAAKHSQRARIRN